MIDYIFEKLECLLLTPKMKVKWRTKLNQANPMKISNINQAVIHIFKLSIWEAHAFNPNTCLNLEFLYTEK